MGQQDIEYLRTKLQLYLIQEEYEKAETMRQWILELGGDPVINYDVVEKAIEQKKGFR